MLVCYLTDEPGKIPAIHATLAPQHKVVSQLLGAPITDAAGDALIVDADLRDALRVEQIKQSLKEFQAISEKLFVVRQHLHHMVAQAFALGATSVVRTTREIAPRLSQIEQRIQAAADSPNSEPSPTADCSKAFASMFAAVKLDKPINLLEAENVTSQVIWNVQQNGLSTWLDDVRRYHHGTFQHCLLVTGIAVGFALEIGFAEIDVKRLGIAATLHDIGKARIPLAILDKPGKLDPDELEIMQRHPVIGYEMLKDLAGITPEILDGVRHHHEYLDGSGYPDGLQAGQISDLVRLLTISDIFAALIEMRAYRQPMSREDAYKVLCGMDGKLEMPLVRAFRNVALIS